MYDMVNDICFNAIKKSLTIMVVHLSDNSREKAAVIAFVWGSRVRRQDEDDEGTVDEKHFLSLVIAPSKMARPRIRSQYHQILEKNDDEDMSDFLISRDERSDHSLVHKISRLS